MSKKLDLSIVKANKLTSEAEQLFTSNSYCSALKPTEYCNNKILKEASPIINYVTHVCKDDNKYTKKAVSNFITNEILYFSKNLEKHHKKETILAARHILCSWCHETLSHSNWGWRKKWKTPEIITDYHQESWQGENFYPIIQRAAASPATHQELLQLCYCCMSLGYQGAYRQEDNGYITCYTIIDKLWQLITTDMGDFSLETNKVSHVKTKNNVKIIKITLATLLGLITCCFISLEITLAQVSQPITGFFKTDITTNL